MYADPRHIRDNPIKVRLNEDESAAIEALARLNKMQVAVFARELLLEGIRLLEQRNDTARVA